MRLSGIQESPFVQAATVPMRISGDARIEVERHAWRPGQQAPRARSAQAQKSTATQRQRSKRVHRSHAGLRLCPNRRPNQATRTVVVAQACARRSQHGRGATTATAPSPTPRTPQPVRDGRAQSFGRPRRGSANQDSVVLTGTHIRSSPETQLNVLNLPAGLRGVLLVDPNPV